MKSRLVLFSTWLGSDMRRAKLMLVLGTFAVSLLGAGLVAAGPMPGGPDVPNP